VMGEGVCVFTWKQYRFVNVYRKTLDLDKACLESKYPRSAALRFLKRRDVVAWMSDRSEMELVKRSWDAEGRWWVEGDKMFKAPTVPRHKLEVWKEFGDRLEVKPGRNAVDDLTGRQTIINISPDAISAIRERERVVEAEIVNGDA